MSLLKPTAVCEKATEITSDMLDKMGVKYLLLDVDNTISSYRSKEPVDGARDWAKDLESKGYGVFIVSNNYEDRVKNIADKFGLPFVSMALKPLPVGFCKAKRHLKCKASECLVVGDQIFTDILGANLGRMKSVLLTPIELETGRSFKIRRYFENKLRPGYESLRIK